MIANLLKREWSPGVLDEAQVRDWQDKYFEEGGEATEIIRGIGRSTVRRSQQVRAMKNAILLQKIRIIKEEDMWESPMSMEKFKDWITGLAGGDDEDDDEGLWE